MEGNAATALERTSGASIASLVLGIAGLFAIPLVLSVLAIIFGNKARQEIRANPSMTGEGFATAGIILGWAGLALVAIGVLFGLLVFAVF